MKQFITKLEGNNNIATWDIINHKKVKKEDKKNEKLLNERIRCIKLYLKGIKPQ